MTTNNAINVGTGIAGEVLTSNGPGVVPTFQAAAGGGALVPTPGIINNSYTFPGWFYASSTSLTITDDRLYLSPLQISENFTAKTIACNVSSAAAGAIGRLGIYTFNTTTDAFSLLVDGGTIDCSTTGVKTVTINTALTVGSNYWFGGTFNDNGGSVSVTQQVNPTVISLSTAYSKYLCYYVGSVDPSSALPSSPGAYTALTTAAPIFSIGRT